MTSAPPWSVELRIRLEPGVPYVPRDEVELEHISRVLEAPGLARRITRQEAYRLRRKKKEPRMAFVAKRGPGRWRARYRGPDGRERSKTFERKTEAERWLAIQTADVVRGEWTDPRGGRIRYGEWLGRWWSTTNDLRPSTRARDETYLRNYAAPAFGLVPLAAIGQLDVRAWVANLSADGLAPATVVKAYQLLGKTLGAAVDAGLIPRSPCRAVPLPKIELSEMRFLTPTQVATLADAIDTRYRALVLVGAYGGLRIGELAGLKRSRVDLLHGRIDIAEILVEVRGTIHTGPPKTRAGRRSVSLPRPIMREVEEHLAAHAADEIAFPAPEGGPLRPSLFRRRVWRPATEAAGLASLRPHDLRHTAVALWIAAGANPKEVAVRAGHTSVSFTLDRYGHLFPEADERLRDRLAEMFVDAGSPSSAVVLPLSR